MFQTFSRLILNVVSRKTKTISQITKDTPSPAQIIISLGLSPLIFLWTSSGRIVQLCKVSSRFRRESLEFVILAKEDLKSMYDTGVDYLSAVKITLQQNEIFE